MGKSTIAKMCAAFAALLLCCIAVRVVFVEKSSEPSYVMSAGTDYIRQEWNYCNRFDNDRKSLSTVRQLGNIVNNALFAFCRPMFPIENAILGRKIVKGDPGYDRYVTRVAQIREKNWDYVISAHPDGAGLSAVRKNNVIQKVD